MLIGLPVVYAPFLLWQQRWVLYGPQSWKYSLCNSKKKFAIPTINYCSQQKWGSQVSCPKCDNHPCSQHTRTNDALFSWGKKGQSFQVFQSVLVHSGIHWKHTWTSMFCLTGSWIVLWYFWRRLLITHNFLVVVLMSRFQTYSVPLVDLSVLLSSPDMVLTTTT